MTEAVTIEGATRRFGDVLAVTDLTLSLPEGAILGLIGPSGAGKTTTVRMLTGGLAPSEGTVRVLGEDPVAFRRGTRERIGYMPQLFSLYPDLSTRENVDFVASLFGMLFPRRRRRTEQVLRLVDLWPARGRRAGDLSGGMQRRLELACALVHDPAIAFLDEPTAGVDPLLRGVIWDELHRLRDDGRTLVITTQYVNEADECDLVALIAEGRLIALADPVSLRRAATNGDVLEIQTEGRVDPRALMELPEVSDARSDGPDVVRVTVDDAAVSTPAVTGWLQDRDVEVRSVREVTPSFDEVFAILVGRHRGSMPTDEAVAPSESEPAQGVAPPGAGPEQGVPPAVAGPVTAAGADAVPAAAPPPPTTPSAGEEAGPQVKSDAAETAGPQVEAVGAAETAGPAGRGATGDPTR